MLSERSMDNKISPTNATFRIYGMNGWCGVEGLASFRHGRFWPWLKDSDFSKPIYRLRGKKKLKTLRGHRKGW